MNVFRQMNTQNLESVPNPAQSYDEAIARLEALQSKDGDVINPVCRTDLLTHGHKTEKSLIYLHGFTNCPYQFHQLGQILYQQGYNVLTPRIPKHGYTDRLTDALADLTAEELATFTTEVVDIAQGLGEEVTLMGLSGGGVMAAWAAQYRDDIAHAMLIAPSFAFRVVPGFLTAPLMNLALKIRNIFVWWDPRYKADLDPTHAYPRYGTHPLAEFTRLAFKVEDDGKLAAPKAGKITIVTNAADLAVNMNVIADLVQDWRNTGYTQLETYEFPAKMGLIHDLIDPGQKDANVDAVYPVLIELLG